MVELNFPVPSVDMSNPETAIEYRAYCLSNDVAEIKALAAHHNLQGIVREQLGALRDARDELDALVNALEAS